MQRVGLPVERRQHADPRCGGAVGEGAERGVLAGCCGLKSALQRPQRPPQPTHRPCLPLACQGAFPEAQHRPAGLAEFAGDEAVALLIAGDLVVPELAVLLRARGMAGAAVHKDGDALLSKDEVRPHAGLAPLLRCGLGMGHAQGHVPPPAGDLLGAQHRSETQLRGRIAGGADEAHQLAALGWGEDIWHGDARLGWAEEL